MQRWRMERKAFRRSDKITGPGNIFVALAKEAVSGFVSIDSIAGPSEILVLADETANPRYVAADLLSQAEHDEMASAILANYQHGIGRKSVCRGRRICGCAVRKRSFRSPLIIMDIFW